MLVFIAGMMLGATLGIGFHCMLIVAEESRWKNKMIYSNSNFFSCSYWK